jgi:ABC-type nitrate/sulfonate/bicarbonate transport system ATPase subunit
MIELRAVRKTFTTSRGTTEALDGIDLEVPRGQLLCMVGPSGCGKTTLLNLVAGLERPDAGTVRVNGRPVTGPGPDRGVLFQEAALFPWLDVQQNVEFGLKEQRVARPKRRRRVAELLAQVGMLGFCRHNVHELSGGMRQRVALARALALEPAVLLMDEPFGALDARTRDGLQAELVTLWRATGKTILFVTHDMAEAVCLGSRVVVLKARPGRVSLDVDVDAVLPRPRTAEQPEVRAFAAALKEGLRTDEDGDEDLGSIALRADPDHRLGLHL